MFEPKKINYSRWLKAKSGWIKFQMRNLKHKYCLICGEKFVYPYIPSKGYHLHLGGK